jgi:hypothetical protein
MDTGCNLQKSLNGYSLDALRLALGKEVRAGRLAQALYVCGEIALFERGQEEEARRRGGGETIRSKLFGWLCVVFMEEVNNVACVEEFDAALTAARAARHTSPRDLPREEKELARCVTLMCCSQKARSPAHARAVVMDLVGVDVGEEKEEEEAWRDADQAVRALFCKHLLAGNMLAVYYAFKVASTRPGCSWLFSHIRNSELYARWCRDYLSNSSSTWLCWMCPLLVQLGFVGVSRAPDPPTCVGNWDANRRKDKVEICADERSRMQWRRGGLASQNEAPWVNAEWKRAYEGSETARFKFVARCQLATSPLKMDVYLARELTGGLVCVKGPYADSSGIANMRENDAHRRDLSLLTLPLVAIALVPDRWLQGVAQGARNSIPRERKAFFAVTPSCVRDPISTRLYSTCIWPPTLIVDWSVHRLALRLDTLTAQQWRDYVLCLAHRLERGVPDWADRNFLCVEGRVVAVDEDVQGERVDLKSELRGDRAHRLLAYLTSQEGVEVRRACALVQKLHVRLAE